VEEEWILNITRRVRSISTSSCKIWFWWKSNAYSC